MGQLDDLTTNDMATNLMRLKDLGAGNFAQFTT